MVNDLVIVKKIFIQITIGISTGIHLRQYNAAEYSNRDILHQYYEGRSTLRSKLCVHVARGLDPRVWR